MLTDMSRDELISQVIDHLVADQAQLPSPPEIAVRLQRALDQGDFDYGQLAKIVQMDPSLTARLLKLSNSALYASSWPIRNVADAIARIGLEGTKNIAMILLTENAFKASNPGIRRQIGNTWVHCIDTAAIASVLASNISGFEPKRAMLGGLLHGIGGMLLLTQLDSHKAALNSNINLTELLDHYAPQLGEVLLKYWEMGDDMIEIARTYNRWQHQHDGIANLADLILVARLLGYSGRRMASRYPEFYTIPAYTRLGLDPERPIDTLRMLGRAKTEIRAIKAVIDG